jgi:nucleoside phosphorylase
VVILVISGIVELNSVVMQDVLGSVALSSWVMLGICGGVELAQLCGVVSCFKT